MSTTVDLSDPRQVTLFHALTLRAHLKLHAVGMSHSRTPLKDFLAEAEKLTKGKYTRGKIQKAVDDLNTLVDLLRAQADAERAQS